MASPSLPSWLIGRCLPCCSCAAEACSFSLLCMRVIAALPFFRFSMFELTFDLPLSAEVGDYGLLHVAELTQLTSLSLDSRLFTDLGMRYITSLKGLLALDLFGAKVTDKGCHEIRWAWHLQASGLQLGPAAASSPACHSPACRCLIQSHDAT